MNSRTSSRRRKSTSKDPDFGEILALIFSARQRANRAVNSELICLYWHIGRHVFQTIESSKSGDTDIAQLGQQLARNYPGSLGFACGNLLRMRQFYAAYRDDPAVCALLPQLSWSHHLLILGGGSGAEERKFYVRMTIEEQWSPGELEHQQQLGLFKRAETTSSAKTTLPPNSKSLVIGREFKDGYFVDFVNQPEGQVDTDLRRAAARKPPLPGRD